MAHPDGEHPTDSTTTALEVDQPPQTPAAVVATRPLLGVDDDGRRHYISSDDVLVYVLAPEKDQFEHVYDLSSRSLQAWVEYVANVAGWDHIWAAPAADRRADDPPAPPAPEAIKRALLGIDADGRRHYLKQPGGWLFVFRPDRHDVEAVYDIPNRGVQTWVDQVAHRTGWDELRYSEDGPFAGLVDQLRSIVESVEGSASPGGRTR